MTSFACLYSAAQCTPKPDESACPQHLIVRTSKTLSTTRILWTVGGLAEQDLAQVKTNARDGWVRTGYPGSVKSWSVFPHSQIYVKHTINDHNFARTLWNHWRRPMKKIFYLFDTFSRDTSWKLVILLFYYSKRYVEMDIFSNTIIKRIFWSMKFCTVWVI